MTDQPMGDISPETITKIRRLMSRELASAGVQEADVVVGTGQDHDGDPAIMVQVKYRGNRQPFDGRAAARALFSLNSMLHESGETRFAYVKHDEEAAA